LIFRPTSIVRLLLARGARSGVARSGALRRTTKRLQGYTRGKTGTVRPAPLDSPIRVQCRTKGGFLATFLALIWGRLHSKTSSFLAFQNAKPFVCNRSVGSFPLFSIFFAFPRLFPPFRVPFAYRCRRRFPALSYDNSDRLPQVSPRVKRKVQEKSAGDKKAGTRRQGAGHGGGGK
jgi:hypothetical protein